MYWSGVLALLGWAATTVAQGNLGGDQTASCPSPANDWQYVGCYDDGQNGGKANFPFRIEYNNPGAPKAYPGLTTQSQLSIDTCLQACRGHGLDFAGIYAGVECFCSSLLPWPIIQGGSTSDYNTFSYYGSRPNTTVPDSQCNSPCPANAGQTCGGPGFLQVYHDPSYAYETVPPSIGLAGNYQYFGCYNGANNGPVSLDIRTTSTVACQTYCGRLGYAYAIRNTDDFSTGNNCGCGSELQGGYQTAETDCNRFCNGTNGAVGGAGSCGGNNAFSVYFNTLIDGCYLVRQPGVSPTTTYVAPPDAGRDFNDIYQLPNIRRSQLSDLTSCVLNTPGTDDNFVDCYDKLHDKFHYYVRAPESLQGNWLKSAHDDHYNGIDHDDDHLAFHDHDNLSHNDNNYFPVNDHNHLTDHHHYHLAFHNHDYFPVDDHNHYTDHHHHYFAFNITDYHHDHFAFAYNDHYYPTYRL
ncbi:MAG: hypothetical protein LQ345_000992 [Seirophora villosa]|nr:MAG: hypothetical protein LQ345_000992 [Seirophora villosa]